MAKKYIVVSAVGKDGPGFLNRITHRIKEIGGNIELQRSTRMAAEFAVILLVSVEGEQADTETAVERISELRSDACYISAREALSMPEERASSTRVAELIASGADQPGIIDAVTLVLFRHHVNIESMDYDTESAPMTGEHLFRMSARVAVPEGVDLEKLRAALRDMESDLNFDVLLRYPVS